MEKINFQRKIRTSPKWGSSECHWDPHDKQHHCTVCRGEDRPYGNSLINVYISKSHKDGIINNDDDGGGGDNKMTLVTRTCNRNMGMIIW